jgi:oligo-1,6-glucosidase
MLHFWLKKGIDGFRLDAVTFISKHDGYPAFPEGTTPQQMVNKYYSQGPRLHEFFKEMNREVLSHYDVMTVAEGPGTTPENVLQLVGEDAKELNMSYHFEHQGIGVGFRHMIEDGYGDLVEFKRIMSKWDAAFETDGWNTVYLG